MSASYPSQKRDGTRMLVDYLSNTLSSELLSDRFTSRKGRRLILFSDFRSPRNSVLTIVVWRAAQILSSETIARAQVLTFSKVDMAMYMLQATISRAMEGKKVMALDLA
jgi:hypothetical protein